MTTPEIILITLGGLLAAFAILELALFLKVFYAPKRRVLGEDEYEMIEGEEYVPYHAAMLAWEKENRARERRALTVTSYDGLTLRGFYYEYRAGAPIEIIFNGYRGTAERDLSAAVERCFSLGHSVLIANQRASGISDGHVITFGVRECRDTLPWVELVRETFGADIPIILGGVSMGAATVMMASGLELPDNVVCILADCGYSTAKEIIGKSIREMHLPPRAVYPLIKLSARIFGGFDLEESSPMDAMKRATLPVVFLHGDNDNFVPHTMSEELHSACTSKHKRLVLIKGAAHGLAYPADKEGYVNALREFEAEWSKDCPLMNRT